jgi:hypothetical protein
MKQIVFGVWVACIVAVMAGPVLGIPYSADKVVPLPAPNPYYTNTDSGCITLDNGEQYIVQVENEFVPRNWKEWYIQYCITPLDPAQPWTADFHINYSHMISMEPALWDNDVVGESTAFWQTYYGGGGGGSGGAVFVAVGYPFITGLPFKVNPQNANLVINTLPFDYNPEWVSLDFAGDNIQVSYSFTDWCIEPPEPASLALLSIGAVALLRRRR